MKINMISVSHPVIKELKELKKKAQEKAVIEDLSILSLLKDKKKKLITFIYCPTLINQESTRKIKEYFIKNSEEVFEVSEKTYFNIVEKENSAGLIGIYRDKIETISKINSNKYKFIVGLDKLENPGNIGTIFRTADGASVDLIVLIDEVVKANSFKVIQASRGMSLFIDKVSCSFQEFQEFLLKNNYDIYLGEPIKGKPYNHYNYDGKIALILGNERFGINENWYKNKHLEVYIPMSGNMGCLNVSVAASILIYEAFVKRNSI